MSPAKKRPLGGAAVIVTTALLLAACSGGGTPGDGNSGGSGPATDTVRTSLTTDPTTFNAAKANAKDDYQVARYLFDTVLRLDVDGTFAGGLATKWEATADQAVLEIPYRRYVRRRNRDHAHDRRGLPQLLRRSRDS